MDILDSLLGSLECLFFPVLSDVDECDLGKDLCNGNAFCTNNIGLYECSCMEGYKGDGYDCRGTCKFSFIFVFSLSQILTIFPSTKQQVKKVTLGVSKSPLTESVKAVAHGIFTLTGDLKCSI